jgi:Fic family protein
MAIRDEGDWEGWIRFFLRGVAETAEEAAETARAIVEMRARHRDLAQGAGMGVTGLRLLDLLFRLPVINVNAAGDALEVTYATANRLIARLAELGLLVEVTGGRRARVFRYAPYLLLFEEPPPASDDDAPSETTESEV